MPCLIAVLAFFFPRVVIVLLYLFSSFFAGAFNTALWPLLAFLITPLSLIAYTWLTKYQQQPYDALFFVVMIVAVVIDLGLVGGGEASRRRR